MRILRAMLRCAVRRDVSQTDDDSSPPRRRISWDSRTPDFGIPTIDPEYSVAPT